MTAALLLLNAAMGLELSAGNLVAASTGLLHLGGTIGSVGFAVGAATGRRAVGLAAAAGLAVLAYLLTYLGPLAGLDWMEVVSPYSWHIGQEPLRTGFDAAGSALLLALAVGAAGVGWGPFRRRDLMV